MLPIGVEFLASGRQGQDEDELQDRAAGGCGQRGRRVCNELPHWPQQVGAVYVPGINRGMKRQMCLLTHSVVCFFIPGLATRTRLEDWQ